MAYTFVAVFTIRLFEGETVRHFLLLIGSDGFHNLVVPELVEIIAGNAGRDFVVYGDRNAYAIAFSRAERSGKNDLAVKSVILNFLL